MSACHDACVPCSWERGAAVFDKYLLDADWALNNGEGQDWEMVRVRTEEQWGKQWQEWKDYMLGDMRLVGMGSG